MLNHLILIYFVFLQSPTFKIDESRLGSQDLTYQEGELSCLPPISSLSRWHKHELWICRSMYGLCWCPDCHPQYCSLSSCLGYNSTIPWERSKSQFDSFALPLLPSTRLASCALMLCRIIFKLILNTTLITRWEPNSLWLPFLVSYPSCCDVSSLSWVLLSFTYETISETWTIFSSF